MQKFLPSRNKRIQWGLDREGLPLSMPASRMEPFCRLEGPRVERSQQPERREGIVWDVCAVAGDAEGGSASDL